MFSLFNAQKNKKDSLAAIQRRENIRMIVMGAFVIVFGAIVFSTVAKTPRKSLSTEAPRETFVPTKTIDRLDTGAILSSAMLTDDGRETFIHHPPFLKLLASLSEDELAARAKSDGVTFSDMFLRPDTVRFKYVNFRGVIFGDLDPLNVEKMPDEVRTELEDFGLTTRYWRVYLWVQDGVEKKPVRLYFLDDLSLDIKKDDNVEIDGVFYKRTSWEGGDGRTRTGIIVFAKRIRPVEYDLGSLPYIAFGILVGAILLIIFMAFIQWRVIRSDRAFKERMKDHYQQRGKDAVAKYKARRTASIGTVRVELGDHGYEILIRSGLLSEAGKKIKQVVRGKRVAVVTDQNVARHYLEKLTQSLGAAGLEVVQIVVRPGEESKSQETASDVLNQLLDHELDRDGAVIALGGGVVGDLAGYAAATFMRGIDLVQIPTSLLAMIDSSIGGKVAINHPKGKNLIGAFHQPKLVLADLDTLATLPREEFVSGMAELVKTAVIHDRKLFNLIEDNVERFLALDAKILETAISTACHVKALIVAQDEKETGLRQILNFGHTFAHAYETVSNYKIRHGEAVAAGMVLAARLSRRMMFLKEPLVARIKRLIERIGLPTAFGDYPVDALIEAMKHDKKIRHGQMRFILISRIGQVLPCENVGEKALRGILEDPSEEADFKGEETDGASAG